MPWCSKMPGKVASYAAIIVGVASWRNEEALRHRIFPACTLSMHFHNNSSTATKLAQVSTISSAPSGGNSCSCANISTAPLPAQ